MSAHKIGRNDPCGSGKKYKRCCGGTGRNAAQSATDSLKKAMADQDFATIEEAQAFADTHIQRANATPRDEFDGLSPARMADILYAPFESSHWLRFADTLSMPAKAPIMILFERLTDAIGARKLKATAKGNLPRAFCREAARAYEEAGGRDPLSRLTRVNKEEDFYDLHVTRIVAQSAGLVRKYKGHFILGKKCKTLLERHGHAGTYPLLLRAHATRFNWAYGDGYPNLPFIQHAFAFSLYLLARHGDTSLSQHFYEDAFLNAFPTLLDEAEPRLYTSAEEQVRRCYTMRTLERFADFFGLATLTPTNDDIINRDYRVVKTPLLDAALQFGPQE